MSEETITVADVSDGPGGESDLAAGTPISLPVVELLTGRGFITGKSGSGKSNTASVVIENLLSNNFPVFIVDSDGEYYGLKEEFEILHAGADEECDIQVSEEHAGKLASLTLEQNVPIILDVSGYLDEDEASNIIKETARQLFAKEKKLKKPFLMLIEECHEYIPEGAGMDQTGKTLIKIGKRGRKHGLGIVGISQRPADVKKDFITQCDWLCWHRLTWDNDTKVVSRILGSEYGDAIEDMGDGEAFLITDWTESIRRVQFHRKQTFDAGATPGLEDFERPDLKSVSGDLVSELQNITDEQERRESELADLRQELDKKQQRIQQLERELEEAKDMSDMADKFAQALLQKSEASYRGGSGRHPSRDAAAVGADADADAVANGAAGGPGAAGAPRQVTDDQSELHDYEERAAANGDAATAASAATNGDGNAAGGESASTPAESADGPDDAADDAVAVAAAAATGGVSGAGATGGDTAGQRGDGAAATAGSNAGGSSAVPETDGVDVSGPRSDGFDQESELASFTDGAELRHRDAVVEGFVRAVESMEDVTQNMLAHYRRAGRATPTEAHLAAGGSGDRRYAYSRNKTLRRAGVVEHRSCGEYGYALPSLVRLVYGDNADEQELVEVVAEIEARAGLAEQ
ncbi:helicase HerA domain-containing protein [Halobaculum sp. D14]|uniref:helicase HerA domain-containing protein n=1 Tax=Halobaculum sp. D14 TaxID=3421642 RepID=UPI003EB8BA5D